MAYGPLRTNPWRVGKPLAEPYDGLWSARRNDYRIIYDIDAHHKVVTVIAVRHRSDAYRPGAR